MTDSLNPWSVAALAEEARINASYVRRLCQSGELQAVKVGRDWLVPREVGDQWLAERRKRFDNPFNRRS